MTQLSDLAMLVISLLPHIVYCDQLTSVSTLSSSSQQDNAHKGRIKLGKEQLINIGALQNSLCINVKFFSWVYSFYRLYTHDSLCMGWQCMERNLIVITLQAMFQSDFISALGHDPPEDGYGVCLCYLRMCVDCWCLVPPILWCPAPSGAIWS